MRSVALIAALLSLGVGQTPREYDLRVAECEGRVRLCWDPADRAETYELAVASQDTPCVTGLAAADVCAGGRCCYTLSASPCDAPQDGSGVKVRARNAYGTSAHWSNVAPVLPCACIKLQALRSFETRAVCEYECYPGAPDRLPNDGREVRDGEFCP